MTAIEPFEVFMLPGGRGKLVETAEWRIVDAESVRRVHALRHFTFSPVSELRHHQLRSVKIAPHIDGQTVQLDINSVIRPFRHGADRHTPR